MTAPSPTSVTDLTVAVSGQGGDGSLTVVTLLGRMLTARGFHLYSAREVASRIKGGHAAAVMRASLAPRRGLGDGIDVLVAFDEEAVRKVGPRVVDGGVVVFDGSGGDVPPGVLSGGVDVITVDFARAAVRDLRRDLYKNSLAFGVLTRVLGIDDDEAVASVEEGFARLPAHLRAANVGAVRNGFGFAADHGFPAGTSRWSLGSARAEQRIEISGNHAIAMGFAAAGGRFFTGYPITPASEILEWMEAHLPAVGGVAIQAEDELAAVNMAIGAALTGVRAMTATSGPGISLMQEGISHAGSAEVPLVIVDSQRAGPSTGMPTKPEQSDLGMLVHGGNGDFPRIVLAPSDPADCFELAVAATNLAGRLQCPVYLAIDQSVAQHPATIEPFDLAVPIDPGARLGADDLASLAEYRRYLVTDDGVSPWALPGSEGGQSLVTGNEHNEWGQVDTDPANRRTQIEKRRRKIEVARPDLPAARRWGDPDADVGIVAIGVAVAPMVEAVERLGGDGIGVAALQPRTLFPVPDDVVEFVSSRRLTLVVEHNQDGQLMEILAAAGAPLERMAGVRRCDGLPFTPAQVVDRIREVSG